MNISFSGCGFIGLYHVGSAACIQTFAPFLLQHKIAGASAGAMAAAALIGNVPLTEMTRNVLDVVTRAQEKILGPLNPAFNLNNMLKEGLERVLPDDIHSVANHRLHISLTRASDRSNIIVSEYESKEDLINVILASSFIPFVSGLSIPRYKGELVVDGCYSDNVPKFNGGNTITISPFSGDQDICPLDDSELGAILNINLPTGPSTSIAFSKENISRLRMAMIPPKPEDLLKICKQGFDDTYRFLNCRQVIQCLPCRQEKLLANYTKFEEWRRRQMDEAPPCGECSSLMKDARSLNLPEEIYQVFLEVMHDLRIRNSGWQGWVSHLLATPYTLSLHSAYNLLHLFLPSESTLKAVTNLTPDMAACPFAPL